MDKPMDRRQFVYDGALLVAGAAAGSAVAAETKAEPDARKILNYNPDMRYRRLGKTGLMLSEISIGGHWRNRGASFIEVYQNCVVFNENAFADVSDKSSQPEHTIALKDNEPLRFGKELEKGLALGDGMTPKVVAASQPLLTFSRRNRLMAHLLAELPSPEFPVPFGVFYQEQRTVHEEAAWNTIRTSTEKRGRPALADFLRSSGDTWKVP